jgi:predicted nucleotidyltransferase
LYDFFEGPPMKSAVPIPEDKIVLFCRKWGIREFSIFGSALRSDFQPESDVDVLVEVDPSRALSAWDWTDMIEELKSLFGREVDLVEKDAIRNPFRRREILSTSRIVYAE